MNSANKHILKFSAPPKKIIKKPAKPPEPTWNAPIKPLAAPLFNLEELIAPVILLATAKPLEQPNRTHINDKVKEPFSPKLLFRTYI